MNNYQKLGLISGQVFMGLVFGLGRTIVAALLITTYDELKGNHYEDLSTGILYFLFGGYIGMQIGIGYDGYKFLKERGEIRDFKKFFGQSTVGLFFGLLIFYYLILSPGPKIDNFLTGLLGYFAPVVPMIGAIVGFDLGLINRLNDTEKKS